MVLNPGVDLVIALDLIVDHGVTVLEAGVDAMSVGGVDGWCRWMVLVGG